MGRDYRGHGVTGTQNLFFGQKCGINTSMKRLSKRRQVVKPKFAHMKNNGNLRYNCLKGTEGDEMNEMLSCAGYNICIILKNIKIFCPDFWAVIQAGETNSVFRLPKMPSMFAISGMVKGAK